MKETNTGKKIVGAVLIAAVAGISGAGLAINTIDPVIQTETVIKEIIKEVPVNVLITEQIEIEKLVEVEKIVEVKVDNGNLGLVLDTIYNNNGNVEYLLNDLDNDELDMIVDRIIFTEEVKILAYDGIKKNIIDELDEIEINGEELEDDDIERLKVYADDIIIEEIDYDDMDAEVLVEFKFEQNDIKYKGSAVAKIRDGKFDEIKSVEVELR